MLTRQQEFLKRAAADVASVGQEDKAVQQIYGGLCHKLPVMIRTCGLCQSAAFIADKVSGHDARATAYRYLQQHAMGVLQMRGIPASNSSLDALARTLPVQDYVRATRELLDAWVYYKRMAVSVLKVKSAADADGDQS